MENRYNIWNKWDKLKTVVLGDTYRPEFYRDVKDKSAKDALLRICEETLEDLDYFESVLKDFGCTVLRPEIDPNDNIMNYIDQKGRIQGTSGGVPKPPLFPRDDQLVIGNKLVYTGRGRYPTKVFDDYNSKDVVDISKECRASLGFAPNYTVVGRDVYIDRFELDITGKHREGVSTFDDIRINYLNIGGHNDGSFHTIKPGAIISLQDVQTYEKTFPGWDLCYLENQSWNKVIGFQFLKAKVRGRWWVPGEENNDAFTMFVEEWLDNWVGYVEETVFDVNVLVLDEHHVCVSNPNNPIVNEFLKKHKMEPVHIPWRHRYFMDGGLHCATLDLEREGEMVDYFPDRIDTGVIDYRP